jgi:isopenicillin-N epimerase
VRRELQPDVHPLQISWGYEGDNPSFVSRHEKQGTPDPSVYLTVPAAIAWQNENDWDSVRERCHELARRARNELGLEPLTPDSREFFRQMVALRLPEDSPKDFKSVCTTNIESKSRSASAERSVSSASRSRATTTPPISSG